MEGLPRKPSQDEAMLGFGVASVLVLGVYAGIVLLLASVGGILGALGILGSAVFVRGIISAMYTQVFEDGGKR